MSSPLRPESPSNALIPRNLPPQNSWRSYPTQFPTIEIGRISQTTAFAFCFSCCHALCICCLLDEPRSLTAGSCVWLLKPKPTTRPPRRWHGSEGHGSEGHGFSRAVMANNASGFSPWGTFGDARRFVRHRPAPLNPRDRKAFYPSVFNILPATHVFRIFCRIPSRKLLVLNILAFKEGRGT